MSDDITNLREQLIKEFGAVALGNSEIKKRKELLLNMDIHTKRFFHGYDETLIDGYDSYLLATKNYSECIEQIIHSSDDNINSMIERSSIEELKTEWWKAFGRVYEDAQWVDSLERGHLNEPRC